MASLLCTQAPDKLVTHLGFLPLSEFLLHQLLLPASDF